MADIYFRLISNELQQPEFKKEGKANVIEESHWFNQCDANRFDCSVLSRRGAPWVAMGETHGLEFLHLDSQRDRS
jgi:hypothetical protein